MNTSPLQQRRAIVFGGSRGIGAAIARRLARHGADVALTYVSAPDKAAEVVAEIESMGRRALAIRADSARAEEIRAAADQAAAAFGVLDIVVVNAGILRIADVAAFSVEDLDQMLAVNVRGVFLSIQAALGHLQQGGRIVTIGSNTAERTNYPGSSVYSMTKAAVAVMVKGIAIDLAPRGITINNVQPGPTVTDMTAEHIEAIRSRIPLQRAADADEIAALVAWLASAESSYMTGSSLTIDGGMAI
ncbi:SDR family NAD(P)-dependent oxidoreductase [Burkholderia gladioli]|uniref:SDR family NAD(P)-dependent oxidoreductase n=1 Tax=Burkholderia gladioli TaxID=28095 RepID=UPI000CFF0218|nr:SDR family oxidoreductase [Burkholderia gladioli]MDD1786806.1 SDR family oxidoreductase [Burkholderia gladioli]PRG93553.1 oxidoreductase [Burkholderia gladioli]PRH27523.1 oxidoreductase [Burkholderia gladioli]